MGRGKLVVRECPNALASHRLMEGMTSYKCPLCFGSICSAICANTCKPACPICSSAAASTTSPTNEEAEKAEIERQARLKEEEDAAKAAAAAKKEQEQKEKAEIERQARLKEEENAAKAAAAAKKEQEQKQKEQEVESQDEKEEEGKENTAKLELKWIENHCRKKYIKFFLGAISKIKREQTQEVFAFQLQIEPSCNKMVFVSNNNLFGIFDGVAAGEMHLNEDNDVVSVQQYARGGILLHKQKGEEVYEAVNFNDSYLLTDGDNDPVNLFVVGFTAHESLRATYIVHFWNANERTFMRSSGVNFVKHLAAGSNFRPAGQEVSPQFVHGYTKEQLGNYFSLPEDSLTVESLFFVGSASSRISHLKQRRIEEKINAEQKALKEKLEVEAKAKAKAKAKAAAKKKELEIQARKRKREEEAMKRKVEKQQQIIQERIDEQKEVNMQKQLKQSPQSLPSAEQDFSGHYCDTEDIQPAFYNSNSNDKLENKLENGSTEKAFSRSNPETFLTEPRSYHNQQEAQFSPRRSRPTTNALNDDHYYRPPHHYEEPQPRHTVHQPMMHNVNNMHESRRHSSSYMTSCGPEVYGNSNCHDYPCHSQRNAPIVGYNDYQQMSSRRMMLDPYEESMQAFRDAVEEERREELRMARFEAALCRRYYRHNNNY